jgi:GNAT superfamily N-acetyltransferase
MIRTLRATEWASWRDLRLRALADSPDSCRATFDDERSQPDEWWGEIVAATVGHPRGGLWVAEHDDELVGMLFGRLRPDSKLLDLNAIWVAPGSRGLGIGTRLIHAAIDWARTSGATGAGLWVTQDNNMAQALYAKNWFQPAFVVQPLREGSHLTFRKLIAELSQQRAGSQ